MYRRATLQTAMLLAEGYQPAELAKAFGVSVNTIHVRRLRFDRYMSDGKRTARTGKPGRPRGKPANRKSNGKQ